MSSLEEKGKMRDLPAFVADVMLGRLTRWLRIFGYDIIYFHKAPDDFLIYVVLESGRVLLTRDRKLASEPVLMGKSLLLEGTFLKDQLREFSEKCPFPKGISRCAECNGLLGSVKREEVEGEVPDYVYLTSKRFWRCSYCGKVFWEGTHQRNMCRYLGYNPWEGDERPSKRGR